MSRLLQTIHAALFSLARDQSGAYALIFALSALPIMSLIGATIDYSRMTTAQTHVQGAADAAALGGAQQVMMGVTNKTTIETTTRNFFNNNLNLKGQGSVSNLAVDITGTTELQIKVTATVTVNMMFGALFGSTARDVAVTSVSSGQQPPYLNVTLLLDISQSMGLGTTDADMKALYNKVGCTFGCHSPLSTQTISNQQVAVNNGIKLRIDSLRSAASAMVDQAQAVRSGQFYNFSVYTFQQTFNRLLASSNNYTSIRSAVSSVNLGPSNSSGPADSYINQTLGLMANEVPTNGTGTSASSRLQYLVLVTDGVYDTASSSCTSGHCTGAINAALCQPFKTKGVTVIVLYTTYLPIYDNPNTPANGLQSDYKALVAPFISQVKPALQSCATTGYFYEATDGPGIEAAFKTIFDKISGVRLKQ